jgi:hypothetical protein
MTETQTKDPIQKAVEPTPANVVDVKETIIFDEVAKPADKPKTVMYTWNGLTGQEPLIRQYILDSLIKLLNQTGPAVGDNGTECTIKVTVEFNPPVPTKEPAAA